MVWGPTKDLNIPWKPPSKRIKLPSTAQRFLTYQLLWWQNCIWSWPQPPPCRVPTCLVLADPPRKPGLWLEKLTAGLSPRHRSPNRTWICHHYFWIPCKVEEVIPLLPSMVGGWDFLPTGGKKTTLKLTFGWEFKYLFSLLVSCKVVNKWGRVGERSIGKATLLWIVIKLSKNFKTIILCAGEHALRWLLRHC